MPIRQRLPGRCTCLLAASLAAFAPLPVLAQRLDPANLREADDDRTDITFRNLTIAQIEDMNVVRESTIVGEIEEVLVDDEDRIVAVVVDTASRDPGGLEADVIMPIEELAFDPESRRAMTTMTAEEIAQLTPWPGD